MSTSASSPRRGSSTDSDFRRATGCATKSPAQASHSNNSRPSASASQTTSVNTATARPCGPIPTSRRSPTSSSAPGCNVSTPGAARRPRTSRSSRTSTCLPSPPGDGTAGTIPDMAARIEVVEGDITEFDVDAIVNAANSSLLGGGGVDGAIHDAAGPGLLAECRKLGGCPTGDAKITKGYLLPARHVIHAVGPVWHGGTRGEAEALGSCYRRALELCGANRLTSVAFSAISTGVYGFPADQAAKIAVHATIEALPAAPLVVDVIFCCFSEKSATLHADVLARYGGPCA